jgi:uncharacterized protein (DUF1330 family)
MSKAYWIARSQVLDPVAYADAVRRAHAASAKLRMGKRLLVQGGRFQQLEGTTLFDRYVLIEFPDFESAVRFHGSPEYQEAAAIRISGGGITEVVIVEGLSPSSEVAHTLDERHQPIN